MLLEVQSFGLSKEQLYSWATHDAPIARSSSATNSAVMRGHSRHVTLTRCQGPVPVHSSKNQPRWPNGVDKGIRVIQQSWRKFCGNNTISTEPITERLSQSHTGGLGNGSINRHPRHRIPLRLGAMRRCAPLRCRAMPDRDESVERSRISMVVRDFPRTQARTYSVSGVSREM